MIKKSSDMPLDPPSSRGQTFTVSLAAFVLVLLVAMGGLQVSGVAKPSETDVRQVVNAMRVVIGKIALSQLTRDGTLRLPFEPVAGLGGEAKVEWWQFAEREDRPGYPRIDPQSGGSGLPGARGEDEDPAYYSEADYVNPELSSRIYQDGKYWLLDRPTHDSGFRFESWLVERLGPKRIILLAGVNWGISIRDGEITSLHHPRFINRDSRFDWHESLRISGFGGGWEISTVSNRKLP